MPTVPTTPEQRQATWGLVLRLAGAVLLVATGVIHFNLYRTGYKDIPTVGPLFLLQSFLALALAILIVVSKHRNAALAGAGFALATLAGYVLSLWVGLFGFHEVRTTDGILAGVLEVAAFFALGASALFFAPPERHTPEWVATGRRSLAPVGGLAILVLVIALSTSTAASSSTTTTTAPPGAGSVSVRIINFTFIPSVFTVNPGESVVVTNHDSVSHTLTATSGASFTTGNIAPGATESFVAPERPGSYPFDCAIHTFMTGTLTVR